MMRRLVSTAPIAASMLLLSTVSAVQAEPPAPDKAVYVPAATVERLSDKPQGWSYALTLATNLNVASNRDVVGQVEGRSFLFGASALASTSYLRGPHELLNTLSLTEAWSRTPAIDRFVKSSDLVDLQSIYNYFVNQWTGPFVRVGLQTSLFKTNRVTADDVTYVRDDDATETQTTSRLRLGDALQPITLSESLGWFVEPVRTEALHVTGRAGFGGRHTFVDGARAVTDDDDEPANVVYTVLEDVHQAGAELFAGLDGKQVEGRLVYNAGVTALFPFLNNDDTDRSILKLTKVQLAAALGMSVVSWLSINYQLKVIRDLQLVDAVQVQNALLFSLQYTRASLNPAAAAAKAEQERLAAEEHAHIAELEARVAVAEQRAAAAEAQLNAAPPAVDPAPIPEPQRSDPTVATPPPSAP